MAGRRKLVAAALWALCLVAVLSGCGTADRPGADEIRLALRQAGSYALDRAFEAIPARLGGLSCLPPAFAPAEEAEDQIPGLGYLVGKWKAAARKGCGKEVLFLLDVFRKALGSLEFEDPAGMLLSDTSLTDKLRADKRLEIAGLVQRRLEENIDISTFDAALAQYNDWLMATGFLEDRNDEPLSLDPRPALAAELVDLVLFELGAAERKVRTTPDLALDKTFIKVFGLDL